MNWKTLTRLEVYAPVIYTLVAFYIVDYWRVYGEFFPTVTALSNSLVFYFLIWAAVLASMQVLWYVSLRAVFRRLSVAEREVIAVYAKTEVVPIALYALLTRAVSLRPTVVYTLLTFVIRGLHKVAEERAASIGAIEDKHTRFREVLRFIGFLNLALLVDIHVIFTMLFTRNTNYSDDVVFSHLVPFLYVQQLFILIQSVVRVTCDVLFSDRDYAAGTFYVDSCVRLFLAIVQLLIIAKYLFVGPMMGYLIYPLLFNLEFIGRRSLQLYHFYRLMRLTNTFQDATAESLEHDPRCVICYEDMTVETRCKQLPCGHCYHNVCLQKWFRENYTCPYCRADMLRYIRPVPNTAVPPGAAHANDADATHDVAAAMVPEHADTVPEADAEASVRADVVPQAARPPGVRFDQLRAAIPESEIQQAFRQHKREQASTASTPPATNATPLIAAAGVTQSRDGSEAAQRPRSNAYAAEQQRSSVSNVASAVVSPSSQITPAQRMDDLRGELARQTVRAHRRLMAYNRYYERVRQATIDLEMEMYGDDIM